jgi:hypothetical protein
MDNTNLEHQPGTPTWNTFLADINMSFSNRWRDFGFL